MDKTNATNPTGGGKQAADKMSTSTVPKGKVDQDKKSVGASSSQHGAQRYALGVATVVRVDYETHNMDIRVETGETFQYRTPITQAGVGPRRFFGSMPEVGDACVIGYAPEESGKTRKPYVLTWLPIGTVNGHDWIPAQPFSEDENSLAPKDKVLYKGVADRVRYKLRHIEPGNVLASSSQGADFVLDEGVMLSNRRGNELRIRDQDQAIILRSLQQFHAGAGFRIYGGMVQREATLLPIQMLSDGLDWAASQQVDLEEKAILASQLGPNGIEFGTLTPATALTRAFGFGDDDGTFTATASDEEPVVTTINIDPYVFLEQGLFLSPDGTVTSPISLTATYGGKPLYRVGTTGDNAVINTQAETFTEYRIEVSHTADGTLPVTEQTDGIDASRIPDAVPREASTLNQSVDRAFIEWVMGTVVGNDPFTQNGRTQYGVPLTPSIFDGEARSPALSAAIGVPVETQAAALFKLTPPTDVTSSPTWWSTTKDGRLWFTVAGPADQWSVQGALAQGARIGLGANLDGESLRFQADGSILIQANQGNRQTNNGITLQSNSGAVSIYGGASTTAGGIDARGGDGDDYLPAVTIESATNLEIRASKAIRLKAAILDFTNIAEFRMKGASSAINIESGENLSLSAKVFDITSMGKITETFSGPTNSLPTNLPLRDTQFIGNPATGVVPGTVDKYYVLFGGRSEQFIAGNHSTTVVAGNLSYTTAAGTYSASAAGAALNLSTAGATIVAPAGVVSLTASAGAVAITASAAVSITGSALTITAPAITMPGAHLPSGGVLTDGCINPLTGTPFISSGTVGVQTVRIGA